MPENVGAEEIFYNTIFKCEFTADIGSHNECKVVQRSQG